jgi:hypothetical protein
MKIGFDFWPIPQPYRLKSSSDLMLRISRLALFFVLSPIGPIAAHQRGEPMADLAWQCAPK